MRLIHFLLPPTISTVVVMAYCRLKWELSTPQERLSLLPGGSNDLVISAIVLGYIVFRVRSSICNRIANHREGDSGDLLARKSREVCCLPWFLLGEDDYIYLEESPIGLPTYSLSGGNDEDETG